MPRKRALKFHCPTCKKPVKSTDRDFPFCSERCRMIDLGKWASGDYKISSPLKDSEELIQDGAPDGEDRDRK